jgi:uncharacterized membrane protein YoaK (UPF0700 family)
MLFSRASSVTSFDGGQQVRRASFSRGSSVTSFDSIGKGTSHKHANSSSVDGDQHALEEGHRSSIGSSEHGGQQQHHQQAKPHNRQRRKSFSEMVNDLITTEDMPVVQLPATSTLTAYELLNGSEEDRNQMTEGDEENTMNSDEQKKSSFELLEIIEVPAEEGESSNNNSPVTTTPSTPSTTSTSVAAAVKKALHERHHFEFAVIVLGGAALAFNAGFVNGSTAQLAGTFVSHITGTTTRAGMSLANHEYVMFGEYCLLIGSFIFGAFISGYMMKQETFQLGREYGPLFVLGSILFAIDALTGYYAPESDAYYYFAAMGCGLQNGLTTKYSGSIIRTTHMTGAGTDIGLVLGRIAQGDTKEKWKLFVLIPLFVMFLLGGLTSVFAVNRFGKLALLVNVFLFLSIGIVYSIIVGQELHIPFWRALFGLYVVAEKKVKKAKKAIIKRVASVKGSAIINTNPSTDEDPAVELPPIS